MDRAERHALQDLMGRLARGDRSAFHPVFQMVWPVVQRFAARLLPGNQAQDADDAAQEALLKIFARAAEFDADREALPWILGCVAYECRTLARKRQRRREAPDGGEQLPLDAAAFATPEEEAMARELERAALEVLGTLGPRDRETILLAVHGNEARGATFRKRLQRALARLRSAWRMNYGAP